MFIKVLIKQIVLFQINILEETLHRCQVCRLKRTVTVKGKRDKHFMLADQREGMYMLLVKFGFRLKIFELGCFSIFFVFWD